MSRYFNLGAYSFPISTRSTQSQIWFDRGLIWCYGFNQEEAVRCFEQVLRHDPNCAMGHWGIAYATGPFYNKPWQWYDQDTRIQGNRICYDHIQNALKLVADSNLERSLIEALGQKHQCAHLPDLGTQWNINYANRMRQLLKSFPQELDVICLTAESLMNLAPWKLWDIYSGKPLGHTDIEAVIQILEQGMQWIEQQKLDPHPGILHFYLHALEMSPFPEKAIAAAEQLRRLCPDSGHLLHMASHIDVLCTRYTEVIENNHRATEADLKYIEQRGTQGFYLISCLHDYHFKMYTAMLLGLFSVAIKAAQDIQKLVTDEQLKTGERYLRTTLEGYYSSKVHVLVRFGRWQAIIDESLPHDPELYPITTILLYYGKGIAQAALGDIASAKQYRASFKQLHAAIPDWHTMANNPTSNILAVAAAMLDGELEYHAGNHEPAYQYLRQAVDLSDRLAYSEPWPWMHPPRHALGALLLAQGRAEQALPYYEDDLGLNDRLPRCQQHADNIWALHGYHECLTRLGRQQQADSVRPKLEEAIARADIKIESSCYCRNQKSLL